MKRSSPGKISSGTFSPTTPETGLLFCRPSHSIPVGRRGLLFHSAPFSCALIRALRRGCSAMDGAGSFRVFCPIHTRDQPLRAFRFGFSLVPLFLSFTIP